MSIRRILCMFIILLVLVTGVLLYAATAVNPKPKGQASDRSIYVGDIITLEISSHRFTQEELREKFYEFEILEIKSTAEGYMITIRTFNTGEHILLLGDKEIIITVRSTLEDIERDGMFEGESTIKKAGPVLYWHLLFYIVASIFALSGSFMLITAIKKNKRKKEGYYSIFKKRCLTLQSEDENYFVYLTLYFKEYLENIIGHRIIGRTSTEIISELMEASILEEMLSDIKKWLTECDMYKFLKEEVSIEEKHRHYENLLNIVDNIALKQLSNF